MSLPILALLFLSIAAPAAGEVVRRADEVQITGDEVRLRAGDRTFLLDPRDIERLSGNLWLIRGDRIIVVIDGNEEVLATATAEPIVPLPAGEEEGRRRRVDIDRFEEGVVIRFRHPDVLEAVIEGSFTAWKPRPMTEEGDVWIFRRRLAKGRYRFLIRYRLAGDANWFGEPEEEVRPAGLRSRLYTLDVGDRELGWYVEEESENRFDTSLGSSYNRVEGLRLTYALGYERGLRRTGRLDWSQGYSFAAERWSWEASVRVPAPLIRSLAFEATGFDRARPALPWAVTENENFLAALLIKEDFFDYVWRKGWRIGIDGRFGPERVTAGYGEYEDEALSKETDWSLFSKAKTFRENLFDDAGAVGTRVHKIEGRCRFDTRNYEDSPTMGWLFDLSADYAGWELGGDHDFRRVIADLRHYRKLSSRVHFDSRVMGGSIEGNAPPQEAFYLGGVGTLRAHRFKELAGNRFFLANVEYRATVWGELQCAFFTDLGDAWKGEGRETFDLESDMGVGIQNDEGDIRVDFARRLDRGAGDDVVVTVRLARTF